MIAEYFRQYLNTESAGTFGTDLFVSLAPDSDDAPDNCIILFDETGIVTDYQSDYGSDWAGMEVIVRGSYSYASDKIWEIHNLVTGINSVDTTDFYLTTSQTQTPPAQYDIDPKGRRLFSAHYLYLIAQKTNEHRITVLT